MVLSSTQKKLNLVDFVCFAANLLWCFGGVIALPGMHDPDWRVQCEAKMDVQIPISE
jgi:hypothetical protein